VAHPEPHHWVVGLRLRILCPQKHVRPIKRRTARSLLCAICKIGPPHAPNPWLHVRVHSHGPTAGNTLSAEPAPYPPIQSQNPSRQCFCTTRTVAGGAGRAPKLAPRECRQRSDKSHAHEKNVSIPLAFDKGAATFVRAPNRKLRSRLDQKPGVKAVLRSGYPASRSEGASRVD